MASDTVTEEAAAEDIGPKLRGFRMFKVTRGVATKSGRIVLKAYKVLALTGAQAGRLADGLKYEDEVAAGLHKDHKQHKSVAA